VESSIEYLDTVYCEEEDAFVVLEDSKEDWTMFNQNHYNSVIILG
jgi:hypothetical protein